MAADAATATEWQVRRRETYADGQTFGDFGAFQIIEGRVRYRVAPDDPRNAGIVDLRHAPRQRDGTVAFSGDYTLVAPRSAPARALLVDVPNRGRRLAFSMFNRASPAALLDDPCAPGDGFLFRRGIAVASIGWQWDASGGLGLDAPQAQGEGEPLTGQVVCRVQPGSDRSFVSFGQLGEVTYPPADLDDAAARLYVRDDENQPQTEIPRQRWRFGRERDGALVPSDRFIHLDNGFERGRIYTLVYNARNPRVAGCGLLALRDAAASLRAGEGPNGQPFARLLAFGASQTGRVLRHLLYLGLNRDADGGRIFDGVHIHIAGGQRGDFNHRFAQPSSAGVPALGQRFPFAGATSEDPFTGVRDGLYRRLAEPVDGSEPALPKVVITNTSWEYWRGDAALTHVGADGGRDLPPDRQERNYLFAGTHHVGGILPPTNTFAVTGEKARYTFNTVDHSPLVRAVLANLERWLDGELPPPSRIPTLAAGTLVERATVLAKFAAADEDFHGLDAARLGGLTTLDLGERAEQGICEFPAREGKPYARLVSDVDDALNEVAGIRLPDIAVPIGCHTGWNPRHPAHGAPMLPAIFVGFTRFRDSLPPLAEYEQQVRRCAERLVEDRYVLAEDLERVVQNCLQRYAIAAGDRRRDPIEQPTPK